MKDTRTISPFLLGGLKMKRIKMKLFSYIWRFIECFGIQTKHAPYIFEKMIGVKGAINPQVNEVNDYTEWE